MSMTSGVSLEILDLRHFGAPMLRPLLDAEAAMWSERLHWDYSASSRLLMQYLDSHMLPGYAAVDAGRITGYAFCVYEESKAVIGDVFAMESERIHLVEAAPPLSSGKPQTPREIERMLLSHLFETLQSSPQVDRIESQLLLHPSGALASMFEEAGFTLYHRLFMVQNLTPLHEQARPVPPREFELRPWRDDDLAVAGRVIAEAYANHPDSLINDQYCSPHGSMRFLHNIVRYAGCGAFSPQVSHILIDRSTREMAGLVLGSRVSAQSGHITQLCIRPPYRRRGLARMLLHIAAAQFWRLGVSEISLTVTEANSTAVALYQSEGYACRHAFDAAVWRRGARS